MQTLVCATKKIDDIVIYYEVYSKNISKDEFESAFDGENFLEKNDNCIVLLHGNGEDHSIFKNQLDALCSFDYVIALDSRGHGKTTVGNEEFSIDLMAEDLAKFADETGLGKFALLGFSDGGNIALTYAVRHPERLCALAVSGANLNPSGLKPAFQIKTAAECFFAKLSKDKGERQNLKYQLLSLMTNHPHISSRLLSNIRCKTLVMAGERDLIKKGHTELIARSIPGAVLEIVPESSHCTILDNPEYVNAALGRFFAQ